MVKKLCKDVHHEPLTDDVHLIDNKNDIGVKGSENLS